MKIYISPSSQEHNAGPGGYIEEVAMNKIADKLCPELTRHGIEFMRNNPANDFHGHIAESNAYKPNYHLAMHSNAMGTTASHTARGLSVYCARPESASSLGTAFARIIYESLQAISPVNGHGLISAVGRLSEVMYTTAPAALVELDYHDNPDGAAWIMANIDAIAHAYLLGILKVFGIAYKSPIAVYPVPTRTLRKGCKGEDVKWLQQRLTNLGYDCGPIDGIFGGKTLAAVKAYQRRNGLVVDGIVGPATRAALLRG